MQITLPYPPSSNAIWRNVEGRTLKSSAYRQWLKEAAWTVLQQRPEPHKGSFRATVLIGRPDRRRRDNHNLTKAILDLLEQTGVIEDDCLAQSVLVAWEWDKLTPGGSVTVFIEPAEFPIYLMGRAA